VSTPRLVKFRHATIGWNENTVTDCLKEGPCSLSGAAVIVAGIERKGTSVSLLIKEFIVLILHPASVRVSYLILVPYLSRGSAILSQFIL